MSLKIQIVIIAIDPLPCQAVPISDSSPGCNIIVYVTVLYSIIGCVRSRFMLAQLLLVHRQSMVMYARRVYMRTMMMMISSHN